MSPPSDPPAIMALLVMVLIGHSTLPFRMHIASRLKGGKRFEELRHLVPLATQRMAEVGFPEKPAGAIRPADMQSRYPISRSHSERPNCNQEGFL